MQALAFQVGDNDFAKLVISKGLESDLLGEQHLVREGLPEFRYAMTIWALGLPTEVRRS